MSKFKRNNWEKELGFAIILALLGILFVNKLLVVWIGSLSLLLFYGFMVITVYLLVFTTAFKFYKDLAMSGKRLSSFKKLPKVSCMVAVFNEEEHITECLDAIFAQDYKNIEVIVVNDKSTDNTLSILKDYKQKHPSLKIINLKKNSGKKAALTRAMKSAKGTIFAHTDSDSRWDSRAISKIVRILLNNPDVGAVSGHGRARNANTNTLTKMQDAWMEGQFSIRKAFESVFGSVTCVSGPLAAFRKEAIYNFLPAWENDKFLGSEFRFATDRTLTGFVLGAPWLHDKVTKRYPESAFMKKIYAQKKWKIVYSRSARSYTIVPNSIKKVVRQQTRWKKSFIRNIFQTGTFIWKKPLPVAFVYYTHILFVFLAPLIVAHVLFLSSSSLLVSLGYYSFSVLVIGSLFALALKLEDKECRHWFYRPLMSLFSTLFLSWLIFYALATVKKMTWYRG
jgi:cellulose synthase/poly-beta-1,6-N-acetylglucosamine synthase-like glycosyltransferase